MKIQNKHSVPHKKAIIGALVIAGILIIGGIAAYYYLNRHTSQSSPSINLNPPTKQEQSAGNQTKSSNAPTGNSNATKNNTSPSTTNSSNTTIQVTASNQNGSVYQLRYLINPITTNATCTLTLTSGSHTITKTASVQALAQSSTCQGFNIPTSELGSGQWTATTVVSGDNTDATVTNIIQVQ